MTDTVEVTRADRDCLHAMNIPASADDLLIVARHRQASVDEATRELVEALERIKNARSAMDGGSIQECRNIATKALTKHKEQQP